MTVSRFNRCPADGYGILVDTEGRRRCSNPDCDWQEAICERCRQEPVEVAGTVCEACQKDESSDVEAPSPPPPPAQETAAPPRIAQTGPDRHRTGSSSFQPHLAAAAGDERSPVHGAGTDARLSADIPPFSPGGRARQSGAGTATAPTGAGNRLLTFLGLAVLSLVIAAALSLITRPGKPSLSGAESRRKGPPAWTNPRDALDYVAIPAGSYLMGCVPQDANCAEDEKPRHRVTITRPFRIGTTEVTVLAYSRFALASRHVTEADREGFSYSWNGNGLERKSGWTWGKPGFPQTPESPVVNVSWNDAAAFCKWAGGRLPTEAEWEYASRLSLGDTVFPWGNGAAPLEKGQALVNAADESARRKGLQLAVVEGLDDGHPETSPVKAFPPDGIGLFGMAGNVSEWCLDRYAKDTYRLPGEKDPGGPGTGADRVVRGGSYLRTLRDLRLSARAHLTPSFRTSDTGFRCVLPGESPASR